VQPWSIYACVMLDATQGYSFMVPFIIEHPGSSSFILQMIGKRNVLLRLVFLGD